MHGFTLDKTVSSTSLGLRLTAPVDLPVAERVTDDIEVAGRSGTLTRLGGWHDTSITLPLAIKGSLAAYHKAALALTQGGDHSPVPPARDLPQDQTRLHQPAAHGHVLVGILRGTPCMRAV